MSEKDKIHFKTLTSFINAYKQKMTQSSNQNAYLAMAAGSNKIIPNSERDGLTLLELNQITKRAKGINHVEEE